MWTEPPHECPRDAIFPPAVQRAVPHFASRLAPSLYVRIMATWTPLPEPPAIRPGVTTSAVEPTVADWWISILQGTAGTILAAVIGALALAAGLWVTIRHERKQGAEQRAAEDRARRDERTAESVADVISAASAIGQVGGHAAIDQLRLASRLFLAREIADHRAVARWTLATSQLVLLDALRSLRDEDDELMAAAVNRTGTIIGALVQWRAGERSQQWFEAARPTVEAAAKVASRDAAAGL